jgi:hypothetical protein
VIRLTLALQPSQGLQHEAPSSVYWCTACELIVAPVLPCLPGVVLLAGCWRSHGGQ